MANGGSPLPTPRPTSSSMPNMPLSPAAIGQTPSCSTLLQPHEHHHLIHDRASFETLTSIASSNPAHSSAQLRRPACNSSHSDLSPEHHPAPTPSPRPRQVRSKYHFHRSPSHCNSPPMRALPPLHPPHEALQWRRTSLEADQLLEGSSDDEDEEGMTLPAGLDLSLGRLYGFPYCLGVPDAMEQRY